MKKIIPKILVVLIVLLGTLSVIYYAKGYRINFFERSVIRTGVLNITTQPNRSHFYITEEIKGRTSRTISMQEGTYDLNIWRDGYHDLKYKIEIFVEKSTPISAFMFRKEPEKNMVDEITEPVIYSHVNEEQNIAFFLVEEEKDEIYTRYTFKKYQANTRFWQFNSSLADVFTFSLLETSTIEKISISPDSKSLILTIGAEEHTDEIALNPGKYLISLDTQNILATLENVVEPIKWSQDGQSILWQNGIDIFKVGVKEPQTYINIYSQPEGVNILNYESYTNGDIYILYETENPYITLSNISSDGTESFVLEKIYYQDENRFLQTWKEKDFINYQLFKSSPQSTIFVGKPIEFLISKNTQSIFLTTEYASYRYDTEENKYVLINPHKTKLLNLSPDLKNMTFLSLDTNQLGIFTFDIQVANHTLELGSRYIDSDISQEACSDIAWHKNSENIYYVCNNTLYVSDILGFNNLKLIDNFGEKILIENSRRVINILQTEESLQIEEYTIN